jgi:hypothetical protein
MASHIKFWICVVFSIGSFLASAQVDSNEDIVLRLVKEGVDHKRLPIEVVNLKDSTKLPHNVIVIHRTRENDLRHGVFLKGDDVDYRIWTGEELFLSEVYWIEPSALEIDRNRASFSFTAMDGAARKRPCYAGKIKGVRKNGKWILVSLSYKKTECRFDVNTTYE